MSDHGSKLLWCAMALVALGLGGQAVAMTHDFEPPSDLSDWYSIDTNGTTSPSDDTINPAHGSIVAAGCGGGHCLSGGRGYGQESNLDLAINEGQVVTVSLMVRPSDWEGAAVSLMGAGATSTSTEAAIRFDQNPVKYSGSSNSRWCSYLQFYSQQAYGTTWTTILEDSEDPIWSSKSDVLFSPSQWYQIGFTIDTVSDTLTAFASGGLLPEAGISQVMQLRDNDRFLRLHGVYDFAYLNDVLYDDVMVDSSAPQALAGDANGDGQVDGNDLISVEENFGATGELGIPGDANGDGQVDGNDLIAVEENFGAFAGASATVPEPMSVLVLAIGAMGVTGRWRVRNMACR